MQNLDGTLLATKQHILQFFVNLPASQVSLKPTGMDSSEDVIALAERFVAALSRADEATARACYAPDATIWHNYDNIEQSVDDNMASMHWLHSIVSDASWDTQRLEALPGGFVLEYVLRGQTKDAELALAACVIAGVQDGRIQQIREYLDPTPMMRALASS